MRYRLLTTIVLFAFSLFFLKDTLFARIILPPIDEPIVKKISIVIPDLEGSGVGQKEAREFVEVLRNDLKNSGLFDVRVDAITNPDVGGYTDFQALFESGAEAFIRGNYKYSGNRITIDVTLFDVIAEKPLQGRSYEATPDRVREAAHRFANLVLKEFTGIDGFFTSKIVYVSGAQHRRDLYIMDYDGHNVRRLTNHNALVMSPHCSPDGTRITFSSDKVWDQDIYILKLIPRVEEQRITRAFRLEQSPEWSPDGQKIAYSANGDIYIANPDGSGALNITHHPSIDVSPTWSPDGTKIAFTSDRSGIPQIYVMNIDGSGIRRLTSGGYSTDPAWSPNPAVNKIAFVRVEGSEANIYTINPDGSDEKRLTYGTRRNENPSWSPDGHYIAFTSTRTGAKDIYIMYLNGENQRQLTKGGGKSFPTWCK
ncbi:Dipeptidyl-peptidase 5 [bacterium HR37]|nr:Dipeptidyl-peptidase 5 [bacterium HR37]